jgi:hypothetical protein
MSHLEEGLLHALLDGEIPSGELPPLQAHLAACPECRARLEAERELSVDAEGLVGLLEVPAAGTTSRRTRVRAPLVVWPRRLAWAATVILAAGLGYVAHRNPPVLKQEIASEPVAPRNDSGQVEGGKAVARERSDRGDLAAKQEIAAGPPAPRRDSGSARRAAARNEVTPRPTETKPASESAVAATPPAAAAASTDEPRRLDALQGNALATLRAADKVMAPAEPITLPDAVRRLGGSLRLIDGMVPLRLEAQGPDVRVVYPAAQGELVLSQQLIDGRIVVRLLAPPGFPADSLARLRARVRE